MFRTSKQVADHELRLASLALAVAELRAAREKSLPAEVFKLIEALQADIDAIRISLRSLHGKVAIAKRYDNPQRSLVADDEQVDAELASLLEFQRAQTGDH